MISILVTACLSTVVLGHVDRVVPPGISANSRISGGVDIDIRDAPYTVALETKGNKAYQYCAGALITPNQILTAAQCLTKPADKLRVRVGSTRRNKGGTTYEIAKYVKHPRFNKNDFDYDVGIIHLESNVTLSDSVKTIDVADVPVQDGTKLTIAGWGITEDDGELWPVLQRAETPLINWETCSDRMKMFLLYITERMMCTQGNGIDACVGDGGGPTVYNGKVTGVISWGIGCGRPFFPSVHTNITVPEIRSFIRDETNV